MQQSSVRFLVADDSPIIWRAVSEMLERRGPATVLTATDGEDAIDGSTEPGRSLRRLPTVLEVVGVDYFKNKNVLAGFLIRGVRHFFFLG
ncbi:MAG: hypothetical protein WAT81_04810 [Candidatus Moraniibacteriota bacterium]